jgi:hypothetical protein
MEKEDAASDLLSKQPDGSDCYHTMYMFYPAHHLAYSAFEKGYGAWALVLLFLLDLPGKRIGVAGALHRSIVASEASTHSMN